MKVSVKETGGFAGLSQDVAAADTAVLGAAAQPIERAVHEAGFFDLPSRVGEWIGSDPVLYEVTVSDGSREHTVSFVKYDESPATAPLRKVVEAARKST
jgi:hypothetical protein